MNIQLFSVSLLLFLTIYDAKCQTISWVNQMGDSYNASAHQLLTDAQGNVYSCGSFNGSVDFDPGAGTNIISNQGSFDGFIHKTDNDGNLIWVKAIGSTWNDFVHSMVIGPDDYLYVVGSFGGTVDFDPSGSGATLTSNGQEDIFIYKLNLDGQLIWLKQIGNTDTEIATDIQIDQNANIYLTGHFAGSTDMDPGTGTVNLTSFGYTNGFLLKLDSAGNFNWVKQIYGLGNIFTTDMAIDQEANVIIGGYFADSVDFNYGGSPAAFDNISFTPDPFLVKFDSSGTFTWARTYPSVSDAQLSGVTTNAANEVMMSIHFYDSLDIDPGITVDYITPFGITDVVVEKLTATGNLLWYKQLESDHQIFSADLYCDDHNNILLSGSYSGNVDFDPNVGTYYLPDPGNGIQNGFIEKFSPNGEMLWTQGLLGNEYSECSSVITDIDDVVYVSGFFSDSSSFFSGNNQYNLNSYGISDAYVMKFGKDFSGLNKDDLENGISFYPNPVNDFLYLQLREESTITIINVQGKVVWQGLLNNSTVIDLVDISPGIYFIQVEGEQGPLKLIKN